MFRLVSPTIILVKILLQHLWEEKRACDVPMPPAITQVEERAAAPFVLSHSHLKDVKSYPYSCTVLVMHHSCLTLVWCTLRIIDGQGGIQTSLVISETKLTIPRLNLYRGRATCLPLQGGLTAQ